MTHAKITPHLRARARSMRSDMTDAELKFWNAVRAHRLEGLSFRRQLPIAGYIMDFACPSRMLIVEIDGSQHSTDRADYDAVRSARFISDGWQVLRFTNDDVLRELDDVCRHILKVVGVDTV